MIKTALALGTFDGVHKGHQAVLSLPADYRKIAVTFIKPPKMEQGDKGARDKLISHNLRLVAHIIKKYYNTSSEQDDLISIGTVGLIKGVSTFDYKKGTRFATYASRCVENAILSTRTQMSEMMIAESLSARYLTAFTS